MKHLRFLLLGLALSLAACNDTTTSDKAAEPEVLRTDESAFDDLGPYRVGLQETSLSYAAPGQEDPRELPLLVWHPGQDTEGARKNNPTLAGLMPIKESKAYKGLALPEEEDFPLAIYSHGSGGEASLAYPFAEQLASRGWIVVGIHHTGNTTLDGLGDGGVPEIISSVHRPIDVREVLDAAELGLGLEGFEDAIRTDDVFLFGHSFGGFTSLLLGGATYDIERAKARVCEDLPDPEDPEDPPENPACDFLDDPEVVAAFDAGFDDDRIGAIALQAPSMMGVLNPEGVAVPTLLLSGDRDQTTTHEGASVPIWEGLRHDDDLWLRFADAGHFSFITVCDIVGANLITNFEPTALEDGCGEDFLAPSEVAKINTAYLVAFAEYHLLGMQEWGAFVQDGQHFALENEADVSQHRHSDAP